MNEGKTNPDPATSSEQPAPSRGRVSWADMAEIILVHFWKAVAVGILVAGATAWTLLSEAPVHEARNVLLIQLGRDYLFVPDAPVSGLRTPDPGDMDIYVNAEIQLLTSSRVLEAALDKVLATGLMVIGPDASRAQLLKALDDAISINLITGSYLIDIRVRSANPALARAVAEAVVDGYMQVRSSMVGVDPPDFLLAQLGAATRVVQQIDTAVVALTGSSSIEEHDRRATKLASQKAAIELDLSAANAEVSGLAARLETLKSLMAGTTAGSAATRSDRLVVLLVETDADLAMAAAGMDVLEMAGAAIDSQLAATEPMASDLVVLRAEREAGLNAVAQLQSQLAASKLDMARAEAGLGMIRVIEKGLLKADPVSLPDRIKKIAAVLVGLLAGLLVIPLFELRSARAHSAGLAAARFGVPVLGEIEFRKRRSLTKGSHAVTGKGAPR